MDHLETATNHFQAGAKIRFPLEGLPAHRRLAWVVRIPFAGDDAAVSADPNAAVGGLVNVVFVFEICVYVLSEFS